MIRFVGFFAAVCMCVVSSGQPAKAHRAEFIYNVMFDMRQTPYECEAYEPATDSCASISFMEQEEGILYNTSWFALPFAGGAPWVFKVVKEYEVSMNFACPLNVSTTVYTEYVSGGVPSQGEVYARQLATQFAEAQSDEDPCAQYFSYGPDYPGYYRVEYVTPYGDVSPRGPVEVRFFQQFKALRP